MAASKDSRTGRLADPMALPVCGLGEKMARRRREAYASRADGSAQARGCDRRSGEQEAAPVPRHRIGHGRPQILPRGGPNPRGKGPSVVKEPWDASANGGRRPYSVNDNPSSGEDGNPQRRAARRPQTTKMRSVRRSIVWRRRKCAAHNRNAQRTTEMRSVQRRVRMETTEMRSVQWKCPVYDENVQCTTERRTEPTEMRSVRWRCAAYDGALYADDGNAQRTVEMRSVRRTVVSIRWKCAAYDRNEVRARGLREQAPAARRARGSSSAWARTPAGSSRNAAICGNSLRVGSITPRRRCRPPRIPACFVSRAMTASPFRALGAPTTGTVVAPEREIGLPRRLSPDPDQPAALPARVRIACTNCVYCQL
jgi:hypothetical protein